MQDLYHRGDDVYKMSMKEWITKNPRALCRRWEERDFIEGSLRHQKEHGTLPYSFFS